MFYKLFEKLNKKKIEKIKNNTTVFIVKGKLNVLDNDKFQYTKNVQMTIGTNLTFDELDYLFSLSLNNELGLKEFELIEVFDERKKGEVE